MAFEPHVIIAPRHERSRCLVAVAMGKIKQGITDEIRVSIRRNLGQPHAQLRDRLVRAQPHVEDRFTHDIEGFLERRRIEMQTARVVDCLIAPPGLRIARGSRPTIGKPDREVRVVGKQSLCSGSLCETIDVEVPHACFDLLTRPVRLRTPSSRSRRADS